MSLRDDQGSFSTRPSASKSTRFRFGYLLIVLFSDFVASEYFSTCLFTPVEDIGYFPPVGQLAEIRLRSQTIENQTLGEIYRRKETPLNYFRLIELIEL